MRGVLTPLTSACWFSPRVGAAKKLRVKSVLLDGEAVIYREDGAADFDKLHSRCFESDVVLYAFDLIELNGSDLSKRPLERCWPSYSRDRYGIMLNEHFEGEGEHISKLGLEGMFQSAGTCRISPAAPSVG